MADNHPTNPESLREHVRRQYGEAARRAMEGANASCCGAGGCCSDAPKDVITSDLYTELEAAQVPEAALLASLGCGNPTAVAELHPGETVLDLGSGGGIDVLLSAHRVGPTGFAYGLDMTDEMLALAEKNREAAGATNVKFLRGEIEAIPLPDASVDVVISNCVINLSADKDRVLREAFRVLKPGGRFAVSDVVVDGTLPDAVRQDMEAFVGCVAGALERTEYVAKLRAAGFVDAMVEPSRRYTFSDLEAATITADAVASLTPEQRSDLDGRVMGAIIRATKPATAARRVQVYDPAMCCSTGVCGPSVDPNLVRVARDLAWLGHQPGITVERFNLGQQPAAFAENSTVRGELAQNPEQLPLVLVDGEVVWRGSYPTREELCKHLGIEPPKVVGLNVVPS